MSTTLAEKIIANASGRSTVRAGEILTARLDLLMMHDSGGPRRVAGRLDKLGARVWDPDKVVVVSDHFVPAVDMESAEILALTLWGEAAGRPVRAIEALAALVVNRARQAAVPGGPT